MQGRHKVATAKKKTPKKKVTVDKAAPETLALEEMQKRLVELEAELRAAKAEAKKGKLVVCQLSKEDPFVVEKKGLDEITRIYWTAKEMSDKASATMAHARARMEALTSKGEVPDEVLPTPDRKSVWFRLAGTLVRRTYTEGRRTLDEAKLFAEHPEIRREDYLKQGDDSVRFHAEIAPGTGGT